MITYSYHIDRLICNQTLPETPDFVESIQFSISGVDNTDGISAESTTMLQFHPGETFTPFDQLTESTVIRWIEFHPMIPTLQTSIAEMILLKRTPPTINRVPPWVVPVAPVTPLPLPPVIFATLGNVSL